jgi:hypothetical protein
MSILQLNPPIPVTVIGKGDGYAMAMIDYSQEHHIYWVCFIDESLECWTVDNTMIRAQKNVSLKRIPSDESKS